MEQADSLWLLPQLRTAVPAATAKPITWMPSAWFGTGLAIAVWGTREDGSSAEEEPVRLHQKTASGPAFHPAQNPVKQQKLLLVSTSHQSSATTNTREVLRQAFAAMPSPSTVLPALQSQTVTVSHRWCHALWLVKLPLTPVGILKTCSLWNLIVIYDYHWLYTFLIDPKERFNSQGLQLLEISAFVKWKEPLQLLLIWNYSDSVLLSTILLSLPQVNCSDISLMTYHKLCNCVQ